MATLSPPSVEEIDLFERIDSQLTERYYSEWLAEMEELYQHPYDFNAAEMEEQ